LILCYGGLSAADREKLLARAKGFCRVAGESVDAA
jgi:hypothetical protein